MKSLHRVLFILAISLICTTIVSAGGTKGQFGLGFKVTDQASVFIARIWLSDKATFEPTIGYSYSEESEIKQYIPGLGFLLHFRPGEEVRPYIGFRTQINIKDMSSETMTDFEVAPLFGCQYFFSDNFSVSGECGLAYDSRETANRYYDPYSYYFYSDSTVRNSYVNTYQALMVHIYF